MQIKVGTKVPWRELRDLKAELDVNAYIRSLINNEVVFHNDKFDFDYVLKEIWMHEDIFAREVEVIVIIETLTEPKGYNREEPMTIQEVFNIPKANLTELLPTKRPEKGVAQG